MLTNSRLMAWHASAEMRDERGLTIHEIKIKAVKKR